MSQLASARGKKVLIGLLALAVIGVGAFAVSRVLGSDDSAPTAASTDTTSTTGAVPSTAPTTATTSSKGAPTCDGPDTKDNLAGTEQTSLLPDCGAPVVTHQQEREHGLGLGCGGSYPVILYKTTTSGAKTSICGKTSSGESFHFVTQPNGGAVIDVPGSYDPQADAFIGRHDGVTYAVLAYDGTLVVTKDGKSTKQKSDDDWISLDNESDYD